MTFAVRPGRRYHAPKGWAPVGQLTDWITCPRLSDRSAFTKKTVLFTPITTVRLSGSKVMRFVALAVWMPGGMIISTAPAGRTKVLLDEVVEEAVVVVVVMELDEPVELDGDEVVCEELEMSVEVEDWEELEGDEDELEKDEGELDVVELALDVDAEELELGVLSACVLVDWTVPVPKNA